MIVVTAENMKITNVKFADLEKRGSGGLPNYKSENSSSSGSSQTQNVIAREITQVHIEEKVTGPAKGRDLRLNNGHEITVLRRAQLIE